MVGVNLSRLDVQSRDRQDTLTSDDEESHILMIWRAALHSNHPGLAPNLYKILCENEDSTEASALRKHPYLVDRSMADCLAMVFWDAQGKKNRRKVLPCLVSDAKQKDIVAKQLRKKPIPLERHVWDVLLTSEHIDDPHVLWKAKVAELESEWPVQKPHGAYDVMASIVRYVFSSFATFGGLEHWVVDSAIQALVAVSSKAPDRGSTNAVEVRLTFNHARVLDDHHCTPELKDKHGCVYADRCFCVIDNVVEAVLTEMSGQHITEASAQRMCRAKYAEALRLKGDKVWRMLRLMQLEKSGCGSAETTSEDEATLDKEVVDRFAEAIIDEDESRLSKKERTMFEMAKAVHEQIRLQSARKSSANEPVSAWVGDAALDFYLGLVASGSDDLTVKQIDDMRKSLFSARALGGEHGRPVAEALEERVGSMVRQQRDQLLNILDVHMMSVEHPYGATIRDVVFGKGDDTVGNPHRAQLVQFELFESCLLLELDKHFSIEQFEPTVSQSTVSSPLRSQTL